MVIIMIPNIIFAVKEKNGNINFWKNKTVETLEQIGRYGCFIFMIVNIPYTYFGFWFNGAKVIYILINSILVIAYVFIWIICFNKNIIFRAISLSAIPSAIFLFSGITILSLPLILFALIFAPCHITISYKNSIKTIR